MTRRPYSFSAGASMFRRPACRVRRHRAAHVVGIVLAAKGEADLAISVVKNSVAQVAVFLFPLLVLVSLLFRDHLTFQLAPVYVGAILLTALALWQITGDDEATVFEGVVLIAMYVTLAAFAWLD